MWALSFSGYCKWLCVLTVCPYCVSLLVIARLIVVVVISLWLLSVHVRLFVVIVLVIVSLCGCCVCHAVITMRFIYIDSFKGSQGAHLCRCVSDCVCFASLVVTVRHLLVVSVLLSVLRLFLVVSCLLVAFLSHCPSLRGHFVFFCCCHKHRSSLWSLCVSKQLISLWMICIFTVDLPYSHLAS